MLLPQPRQVALEVIGARCDNGSAVMSGREEKAAKKAARERLAWYHDAEARRLALRLEEALVAYRREEIDVFQLDDVVAQYRRARRQLDYFCLAPWCVERGRVARPGR